MNEQKEIFFVGIQEPVQMRRSILGCSKDIIHNLRLYETNKSRRAEKGELVAKLKRLFEEINMLNTRLRAAIPKANLKSLPKPVEVARTIPVKQSVNNSSAIDKLEQELLELESKLERLK
ncbi:MAG: hypothetical protein V1837_07370 [Candidatus Woesearchaeota archaeon]